MRIFLDANVLFSAAKSDGAIRALLDMALKGGHRLVADEYVVEEARRSLAAKAPAGIAYLARLRERVEVAPLQPSDKAFESTLPLPTEDRPVLAAAIRLECGALVTGDRTHFPALIWRAVHRVAVHSPRSLAELLLK